MGDAAKRIALLRKTAMDKAAIDSDWRNEIVTHIPFVDGTVAGRGSSKVPEGLVENLKNVYINLESSSSSKPSHESDDDSDDKIRNFYTMTSPTQIRTSFIRPTVTIDLSTTTTSKTHSNSKPPSAHTNARIIRVDCSGSKVPVRSSPTVKAATLRYLYSGAEMEVLSEKVKGYYQLTNGNGYVNSKTSGVEWIDITPVDLMSIKEGDLEEEDEEDEKTALSSIPIKSECADPLSTKSVKSDVSSICVSEYPPDSPVKLYVDVNASSPAWSIPTSTSYESESMYPLSPASECPQSPGSSLSSSPYSLSLRTVPLTLSQRRYDSFEVSGIDLLPLSPVLHDSHVITGIDSLAMPPVLHECHDDSAVDDIGTVPQPLFPWLYDFQGDSVIGSLSDVAVVDCDLKRQCSTCVHSTNSSSSSSIPVVSCPRSVSLTPLTTPQDEIEENSTFDYIPPPTRLPTRNQVHTEEPSEIQENLESPAQSERTNVSLRVFGMDSSKVQDDPYLPLSQSPSFDAQSSTAQLITIETETKNSLFDSALLSNTEVFAPTLPHPPLNTFLPASPSLALPYRNIYPFTLIPARRPTIRINVAVVGRGGCGKSTLLRSLLEPYEVLPHSSSHRRGVRSSSVSGMLSQRHIQPMNGTVADGGTGAAVLLPMGHVRVLSDTGHEVEFCLYESSNYGDCVNNSSSVSTLCESLLSRHRRHWELDVQSLTEEQALSADERIHLLFYVLEPHRLRALDKLFLSSASGLVPVVPVVCKSDAMTLREKDHYLDLVRNKLSDISKQLGHQCIHAVTQSVTAHEKQQHPQILTGHIYSTICDGRDDPSTERHLKDCTPHSESVQVGAYPWAFLSGGQHRPSDLQRLQSDLFHSDTGLKDLMDATQSRSAEMYCASRGLQRKNLPLTTTQDRDITIDTLTRYDQRHNADNYDDSTCETITDMTSLSQPSSPPQTSPYKENDKSFLAEPNLQSMTVVVSPTTTTQKQYRSYGDASPSSILFRSRTTPRPNEANTYPATPVNLKLNLSKTNTLHSSAFVDYSETYPTASEDCAIEALEQSASSPRLNAWRESEACLHSRSGPNTDMGGRESQAQTYPNRPVSARSGMSDPLSARSGLSDPKSARSGASDPLSARSGMSDSKSARSGPRQSRSNSKPSRVSNGVFASVQSIWGHISVSVSRKSKIKTEGKGKGKVNNNNNLGAKSEPKDVHAKSKGSAEKLSEVKQGSKVKKTEKRRLASLGCVQS